MSKENIKIHVGGKVFTKAEWEERQRVSKEGLKAKKAAKKAREAETKETNAN